MVATVLVFTFTDATAETAMEVHRLRIVPIYVTIIIHIIVRL